MESPHTLNIADTALAFRGYNITNLGRTGELLAVPSYQRIVEDELNRFGTICNEYVDYNVSLVDRVKAQFDLSLEHYEEAISLIMATEVAQIRLLTEIHGVEINQAKLAFGYSLGELTALGCGGMFNLEDMIRIPLAMARDCVALAEDAFMGVLFSRGPKIEEEQVVRLCLKVTSEGKGTIGVSAILSPNSMLLIGQNKTVERFREVMHELLPHKAHLRMNSYQWPPLHTAIVRQKQIPDRASVLMETMQGGVVPPCPPLMSLATGQMSYDDHSAQEVLRKWIDHPQRLWDAVMKTLSAKVDTVLHIGPEPNVIPATFRRLSENVEQQTTGSSIGSLRMRAVSGLARRPWLASLLPANTALLRAPQVEHVILEDWLIENAPK